jgi:predicted amidohydrolase
MFKKLSMAALFVAFISGPAISREIISDEVIVTDVKFNEEFTKIIVNGNAEIILTRGESMTLTIEDEASDSKNTVVKNKNGVLQVSVFGRHGKRPVIRIPVQQLQALEINGNGHISSSSYLEAENLKVLINGSCKVALRVIGRVTVEGADGVELEFQKNEIVRIIREAR